MVDHHAPNAANAEPSHAEIVSQLLTISQRAATRAATAAITSVIGDVRTAMMAPAAPAITVNAEIAADTTHTTAPSAPRTATTGPMTCPHCPRKSSTGCSTGSAPAAIPVKEVIACRLKVSSATAGPPLSSSPIRAAAPETSPSPPPADLSPSRKPGISVTERSSRGVPNSAIAACARAAGSSMLRSPSMICPSPSFDSAPPATIFAAISSAFRPIAS